LTGRRRDGRTDPFTVHVNKLSAGGDVDVVIHDSVRDPGAPGLVGGVNVEAPGASGTYFVHFHPDGDAATRAGLDRGVFADVADATPIASVYDLTSVSAGDDVKFHAGSGTAVDLVVGLITATDVVYLDTTGQVLDTADNGAIDVKAFELDLL